MPTAQLEEFSWLDRLLMFFLPTHIANDVHGWQYIHYKFYRGYKVITFIERYH